MIMTQSEQGVRLPEGLTHTYPLYQPFATYYGIRLLFWGSNVYQLTNLTQNIGFSIPFHLYIHDHDLEQVSGTLTCEVFIYVPPISPNGYIFWYLVTLIWVRWIPIHQITSNLGFSIPFHLYSRDHDSEQVSGTLSCGVFMYVPLILPNAQVRFLVFGYLYLGEMDTDRPITSNLGFSISFPPLHS